MNEPLAVNLTEVLDRIDGDRELLLELIEIFFTTMPTFFQHLQTTAEEGYASRETLRLMHELKGTAANLGAEELSRLARRYEESARHGNQSQALTHLALLLREYEKVAEELNLYRQQRGL